LPKIHQPFVDHDKVRADHSIDFRVIKKSDQVQLSKMKQRFAEDSDEKQTIHRQYGNKDTVLVMGRLIQAQNSPEPVGIACN